MCPHCRGCAYLWGGWLHRPALRPCPWCNRGPEPLWDLLDEKPLPVTTEAMLRQRHKLRLVQGGAVLARAREP